MFKGIPKNWMNILFISLGTFSKAKCCHHHYRRLKSLCTEPGICKFISEVMFNFIVDRRTRVESQFIQKKKERKKSTAEEWVTLEFFVLQRERGEADRLCPLWTWGKDLRYSEHWRRTLGRELTMNNVNTMIYGRM